MCLTKVTEAKIKQTDEIGKQRKHIDPTLKKIPCKRYCATRCP